MNLLYQKHFLLLQGLKSIIKNECEGRFIFITKNIFAFCTF